MTDLKDRKLTIVGLGKLGGILIDAFLDKGLLRPESVNATVHHPERAQELAEAKGIRVTTDNAAAVAESDIVILAVKPYGIRPVCEELRSHLRSDALVISVAASVPTSFIEESLGQIPVVRAMPNTPAAVGCGMTGICTGRFAGREERMATEHLFNAVGRTVVVDEKHMDAVTGLSASGPAFLYVVLESLAEAGVKVGLPRDVATLLAAQTTLGAAQMVLQTGSHPALLKDAVTTPAGCTIDGLMELEEGKTRVTLIKAVVKAAERARNLIITED